MTTTSTHSASLVPVLEVVGLNVTFPSERGLVHVIDDVDLRIETGRTLSLVGESGSGKSVTSLAIMDLLNGTGGKVTAERLALARRDSRVEDLLSADKSKIRRLRGSEMAMIFQEPMTSLNPSHSVGQQIIEVLAVHRGVKGADARMAGIEMLVKVGIPDPERRFNSYPHEMSGGMRQRIMIAMALVCGPTLLIADEPTTALDVTIQAQILDLLRRLQSEFGMGMLFITHDLGVVAEIAHDVAVMYAGQIVERGTVEQVLLDPLHPYTAGLLASVPRADQDPSGHLSAIPGRVPDLTSPPSGCRFHPRCPHFVAGRCDVAPLPLEDTGAGRLVRCVRWQELQHALA